MRISGMRLIAAGVVLVLSGSFGAIPLIAQDQHVVAPSDLRKAVVDASQTRENHLAEVKRFLSSETARKALRDAGMDSGKVQVAVSQLDDQELAQLASRTEKLERDFAAGALNNQQITYIIIALATAVIILVIVAAR